MLSVITGQIQEKKEKPKSSFVFVHSSLQSDHYIMTTDANQVSCFRYNQAQEGRGKREF